MIYSIIQFELTFSKYLSEHNCYHTVNSLQREIFAARQLFNYLKGVIKDFLK